MSISAKQLAANQRNAQHSTGPRTDAGKRISRMNATTHGLTGQTVLKTPEEDAIYRAYSTRLMPDPPANAIELDFAERIVYDSWRIRRASAIEANLYALAEATFDTGNVAQDDALNDACTYQVNDRTFNLLSLYQQRLQRSIHKDLEMLRKMQKDRRAAELLAAKQPAAVTKSSLQLVDKPPVLPISGSVCSPPPADPAPPRQQDATNPENMAA
jgi:hypothetical protein